jgi:hypothetical protein
VADDLGVRANSPWYFANCEPVRIPEARYISDDGLPSGLEHNTSDEFVVITQAGQNVRIRMSVWRRMQYLVQRKERDAFGFIGSATGYLINARDSLNYSDAVGATLVSVSGTTVTVELDVDTVQNVTLFQARRAETEIGWGYVTGYGGFGVIQPGDVLWFDSPSILRVKSTPTIKEILSVDLELKRVTFRVDQDVSNAMVTDDAETEAPEDWTCRIWNQAGNPESWMQVLHPTYLRGRPKLKPVVSADLPEDGILALETGPAVAHPNGFKGNVFSIEGRRIDNSEWEDVGDATTRIFHRTLPDETYDSVVSFKTAKPAYATEPEATLTDLTLTYSHFKIHYWVQTALNRAKCKVPCFSRCKHSKPDYTKSIHNYDAPNGTGTDADGLDWYCDRRRYVTFTQIDTDEPPDGLMDSVTATWHSATGVANYPSHGQCLQYGTCDHFEAAENNQSDDAPFDYRWHASRFFRDLWGACNTRFVQFQPGISHPSNFQLQRIKHAGIQWLAGVKFKSFEANHPKVLFYGEGYWDTAVRTYIHSETQTVIRQAWQHNYLLTPPDEEPLGELAITDGPIPTLTDFKPFRDPLDAAEVVEINEIERLGIRNVRDTGDISARGLSRCPKALVTADIELPVVDWALLDEPQVFGFVTVERYETPVTVLGASIEGCITFAPLRQPEKSPSTIGSRTIHSVTSLGSNQYQFDLENEMHDFVYRAPPPNQGSNAHIIWYGGGAPPIYPIDPLNIDSYEETDKTSGSPYGGAARGDTASVAGYEGYEDWRFLVQSVAPYGGTAASDWGPNIVTAIDIQPLGYFAPAVTLDGTLTAPPSGDFVVEGATVYERQMNVTRPTSLATETFWVDEQANRIYFSPADDGANLTVRFIDSADITATVVTETPTVDTTIQFVTHLLYTDWTGADTQTVTRRDDGSTIAGYSVADVGGDLAILLPGDEAGRWVKIRLDTTGTAPSPGDGVTFQGADYESFGKKRDRVVVLDESGFMAANIGTLPGKTMSFHWADGVFVPFPTLYWLDDSEAAEVETVSAAHYISEHGRGKVHLKEAFFVDRPNGSFRF